MWRDLALPSWVLSLWLASAPAMAAGADGTLGRDANSQWSSGITKVPTPVRRGSPARKPILVSQAQAQTPPATETPAAPASGANPEAAGAEDALKAEMEKRFGDAERLYRELLAKDPGRVDLRLRLVDILAAQGKKLEAAQTLAQAADKQAEDADLQLRASQAFGAADRPADALRYVNRALVIRPTDQALQRQRAQIATWAGDYAQAVESLRALVTADPADLKAKRDLAQVLGWQGHWDEAANIVSGYVAEHPADKGALLDLARIQSAGGDMDAAQQSLQRYRDAGGDEETYKRELAKVLSDTNAPIKAEMEKRYGDAERMYREMLAREPDRTDLSLRLVDVLAAENKQAEAAAILAKVADAKADDADIQARASEAAAGAERLADALRYIDRAIALRPTDLALQQRRAQLATWAGKYSEAEKSLKMLIEANPTDVTLKRDLGRVLMWQHQLSDAAGLLGQFLAEHPDDKQVLLDLSQIETERKNFKAAADLLRRYREAGGDEATYRHELARGITPPHGPAVSGGRAGGAAPGAPGARAGAPAAGIPPDVIKAESAKRWSEAERLLRGHLARDPRRVELWLRLVQVLAAQKKTLAAAQAMARAADLKPSDAELQLHTSEAFGAANRPTEALRYVDRALAVHPNDLALHKRRVQLANWGANYPEAEESLRVLIAADPSDLTLKRDLGKVLGWEGRSDEAAAILWDYVEQRPTDKDGLLALARVQAGRGGSQSAAELLDRYRAAGGDELTYQHEMALDLAWGGRLRSALVIADAGLARDPTDFPFHYARAVALLNGYEYGAATDELNRLTQLRPNASELGGLRRSIEVPQRPYLQFDSSGYHESDHITTQTNLISYHQPINDAWWLFAGGTTDYLDARTGSGFAPIQGGHFMARGAGYVGAQALLGLATVASAQAGATGSGRGDAKATWLLTASSQLSDDLRLQLYNTRDFQIVSPRSLSLGITRIDTDATATFTPDMLWTVVTTAHEAELSDGNRYLRGVIAPRRGILRTQYWNVDLGVTGDWSGYSLKPLNGYYSPSFYQKYLANSYVYYKMSDEDGISLIVSLGVQRDETFQNFKLATGVYTEATFGLLSDWMWKIRGGYSNNGSSAGPGFSSETVGVTLVKRF